jgi:DNA-binding NarL/FixJ family response regulator
VAQDLGLLGGSRGARAGLQERWGQVVASDQNTIMIVDDHPMMRRGLSSTLESEPGYEVVLQLERAEQVLEQIDNYDLDLLIVDVSLPGMNGIELVKNIIFQNPDQKILVVSRHEETLYAERALRAGAKGYVMKFESSDVLLKAVQKVLNGGIYISQEMNEKLLMSAMQGRKDTPESPVDVLSDRELEVFELIGHGKSSTEIAEQLHLATKTVETYRPCKRHSRTVYPAKVGRKRADFHPRLYIEQVQAVVHRARHEFGSVDVLVIGGGILAVLVLAGFAGWWFLIRDDAPDAVQTDRLRLVARGDLEPGEQVQAVVDVLLVQFDDLEL